MRILLDTHILIWLHTDRSLLSHKALDILQTAGNDFFYSSLNIWEAELKNSKKSSVCPISGKELLDLSIRSGMICLAIKPEHTLLLSTLRYAEDAPKPHKDPFDKMLICQAKAENMKLMTHDALLPHYNEPCVLYV